MNGRYGIHRPWHRPGDQQGSCSGLDASLLPCPRRNDRILSPIRRTIPQDKEATSRTADEQGVPGKDSAVIPVSKQIADAVLGVTRRMESRDRDSLSQAPLLAVSRRLGDGLTLGSARDGQVAEMFALRDHDPQPSAPFGSMRKCPSCNCPRLLSALYHFIVAACMIPMTDHVPSIQSVAVLAAKSVCHPQGRQAGKVY